METLFYMQISEQFKNIRFNYKIWLSTNDGINLLGDGKWKILKAIESHGSLKAATDALGITYRRTWGDLKAIEEKSAAEQEEIKDAGSEELSEEAIPNTTKRLLR